MSDSVDEILDQIDDSQISEAYLGGLIGVYHSLDSSYVLDKENKQGFIEKRNFQKIYLTDKAKSVSNKFRDDVHLFINRICSSNSDIDFTLLGKNLSSLKIKVDPKFIYYFCFEKESRANYTVGNNTISLLKVDARKNIFHELFHTASSYEGQNGFLFAGFRQYRILDSSIGLGLNEGYTQLLTERYFYDLDITKSYPLEVKAARNLESIIGREKMEKLYFKADLYGLKEECEQYYGVDSKFEQFLRDLDWVCSHETRILKGKNKEGFHYLQRINNYLACLFLGKQQFLLRNQCISQEDYRKNVSLCLKEINTMNYTIEDMPYCWCCDKEELVEELEKMGFHSVHFDMDLVKNRELKEMLSTEEASSFAKKTKR